MKSPVVLMRGEQVKHKIGEPTSATAGANAANNSIALANVSHNTPVRAAAAAPAKRPAGQSVAGASAPKRATANVIPIHAVNQFQRGLSVKGRVTSKSAMKHWANERGTGSLFSFDLQDDTSEIRVTAFKEQAKLLFDTVQMGQVYIVSKPQVKQANKRFSTLPHEFELTVGDDTLVTAGDDNDLSCPQMQYRFVPLREIQNAEPDSFVDIVAVVHRVGDVVTIIQKATQKELKKRDVTLVDDSQAEIVLTLWAREAEDFAAEVGTSLILKKGKVSGFNGRSLNASVGCSMQLNPVHPEAGRQKDWYEATKNDLQLLSLTNNSARETPFRLLFQVIQEVMTSTQPVFTNVRATLVHLMKTSSYDACPTDKCKKRVVDMNNGVFRCEKCNKDFDKAQKRFLQSVLVGDATGDLFLSLFHEEFLKLLEVEDEELKAMDESGVESRLAQTGCRQYVLKLKVFRDSYNEKVRTKATVLELKPVDNNVESRRLLSNFRALTSP